MSTAKPPFEHENKVFERHRAEWLREEHEGDIVVIKGDKVLGIFPSFEDAYSAGSKEFGRDFLVRKVTRDDDVQIIHRTAWGIPSSV